MKNVKYIFCIVFCLGMMNGVMAQNSTDSACFGKTALFYPRHTIYAAAKLFLHE